MNGDSLDDSWHTLWAFWPAIRHSTLEGGPRRGAERAKELFGGLYAEASQASAEAHPPKVFSLLGISLRSDRTITRQMPRTLLRLLVPAPVLTRLRPLGVAAVSIM